MNDVLSVVAEWALAGHITERGVTCEAGDAIRAAVAEELGPPLRVPACPFAVFDEFGEGADDRVHDYAARLVACAEHEHADATKRALFQAQEAAKELLQKLQRLETAMQWIEDRARAGKLEIAPSVRGTGFEFGFWPQGRALVITGAPTLLDALDMALGPNVRHERERTRDEA